jgi:hypothetical protein
MITLSTEKEVLDFLEGFDGHGLDTTDHDLILDRLRENYDVVQDCIKSDED